MGNLFRGSPVCLGAFCLVLGTWLACSGAVLAVLIVACVNATDRSHFQAGLAVASSTADDAFVMRRRNLACVRHQSDFRHFKQQHTTGFQS